MARIVDQWGQPLDRLAIKAPQTSRISALANEYLTSSLSGLTPARLVAALQDADAGNLIAQHRIFADMEERDAHLAAVVNKRKLALLGLDWRIEPPRNTTAAEKAHAALAVFLFFRSRHGHDHARHAQLLQGTLLPATRPLPGTPAHRVALVQAEDGYLVHGSLRYPTLPSLRVSEAVHPDGSLRKASR